MIIFWKLLLILTLQWAISHGFVLNWAFNLSHSSICLTASMETCLECLLCLLCLEGNARPPIYTSPILPVISSFWVGPAFYFYSYTIYVIPIFVSNQKSKRKDKERFLIENLMPDAWLMNHFFTFQYIRVTLFQIMNKKFWHFLTDMAVWQSFKASRKFLLDFYKLI